jgi:hypothetical protein
MNRIIAVMLLSAVLATPGKALGKAETHRHPDLPFQFKVFEGWKQVPRPGDEGTFEMASPNGELDVMLWYTSTEQDARRYLIKMADMKGLELHRGQQPDTVRTDHHMMLIYDVTGTILAVIHNGQSIGRPVENALYITQISCPREKYEEYRKLMRDILGTVRVTAEGGP